MGIWETPHRSLAKLVMRAAGDQAKTTCGHIQLCASLKAGIEGATHAVGQQILERSRARWSKEEARRPGEEEETESVVVGIENINIETAGTYEKAAEGLEAVLGMEIEEEVDDEGEEGGDGTLRALGALEFLTQDADPIWTNLVYACNGFNTQNRLAMLWTVQRCWPVGVRFAFNCYMH